ncbi:MAG: DUF4190 domain-containing protein [Mycobacterium sp.]
MTAHGDDHREESRDEPAPFPHPDPPRPDQPQPWQQYPHPSVDPQAPVNYPEYPPPYPPQPPPVPPYGYPPPHAGPIGYGGPPPGYPAGPYDPYQPYPAGPGRGYPHQTNGLAIASLITSIVSLPLTAFCFIGLLVAIVAIVLGVVALNQIKQTYQQGRGLAIAGIAVGSAVVTLALVGVMVFTATLHSPMIGR